MLNSFFISSAYVIGNTDNAQLFLRPQRVHHVEECGDPVTVQSRARLTLLLLLLLLLSVIFGTQTVVTHLTRIRNVLGSSAEQGEPSEGNRN
jgi:hypothetical protein